MQFSNREANSPLKLHTRKGLAISIKMAGDSAKKILQRNRARISFLHKLVSVSFLQHVLVRFVWQFRSSSSSEHPIWKFHTVFWSCACLFCYRSLLKHAKPTYDAHTKELVDPGMDLSQPGLTQYYYDCVYVTCASMWLSSFVSDRFWYLTYFVPAYGAYALWGYVGPYVKNFRMNNKNDSTEERESKHEKRMRERRERRQQKSGGNRR